MLKKKAAYKEWKHPQPKDTHYHKIKFKTTNYSRKFTLNYTILVSKSQLTKG